MRKMTWWGKLLTHAFLILTSLIFIIPFVLFLVKKIFLVERSHRWHPGLS